MENLLKYAIEHGMIDLSYVQEQVEMDKRKELLKKHPYSIWEGKDGKWRTYLPDQTSRRMIKRSTRKSVEDTLVEYYKSLKENQPRTFDDVYWMWRQVQDELVESPNTPVRYDTDYERYFKYNDFSAREIDDINEVLTDIKGRAAFRALDKNMSYKTAFLFTPEELEERAEKERKKAEKKNK